MNLHTARPWQLNAALLLLGTGLLFLSKQLLSEYESFTIGLSGVSGYSAILYLAAVFLVLSQHRAANRFTFPIILSVAVACRLVTLYGDPFLSSDIYRYVWDGIVQHAHISPYRYFPADPALAFLHGPGQPETADIFANINRRDYARTIYPPAAEALFFLVTWISPTITCMKMVLILFEGVTLAALIAIMRDLGLSRHHALAQSLLYAWCPLLIWEVAGSGHLDSAALAFIALALLFRLRRQPWLTGLCLAVAVLLKLYPIVLLPALLMRRQSAASPDTLRPVAPGPQSWTPRAFLSNLQSLDLRTPALTLVLILAGYAAYSSVGRLVFGFLGGYVQEEGIATGARFFLLEQAQHLPGLHHLPIAAFYVFCTLVFLVLTLWAVHTATAAPTTHVRNSASFLKPAAALALALMLLFSPHYPWYILWLIPFFTLQPSLPLLAYLMGAFYLMTTALAEGTGPRQFLLNQILYSLIALAFVIQLALRRWPHHHAYFTPLSPDATPRPAPYPAPYPPLNPTPAQSLAHSLDRSLDRQRTDA